MIFSVAYIKIHVDYREVDIYMYVYVYMSEFLASHFSDLSRCTYRNLPGGR